MIKDHEEFLSFKTNNNNNKDVSDTVSVKSNAESIVSAKSSKSNATSANDGLGDDWQSKYIKADKKI